MKNLTDITVILDRSGSMEYIKNATIKGFNSFIKEQKQTEENVNVSLVQFDNEYKVSYESIPVQEVRKLNKDSFEPRGTTALFDAIGTTIDQTKKRFKLLDKKQRPENVLIVIITDGAENASNKFTEKQIFKMIEKRERKDGWNFVFIGSNQDAIYEGAKFGIKTERALTFANDDEGAIEAFASLARAANYMKKSNESFVFEEADRVVQER
jgi:uncharacterized protein YegL